MVFEDAKVAGVVCGEAVHGGGWLAELLGKAFERVEEDPVCFEVLVMVSRNERSDAYLLES